MYVLTDCFRARFLLSFGTISVLILFLFIFIFINKQYIYLLLLKAKRKDKSIHEDDGPLAAAMCVEFARAVRVATSH